MEKDKSLEMAVMQIERQFGRGSIMKLGAEADRMAVEVIPTGSLSLDIALGVGGVPRGRVIEIFGDRVGVQARSPLGNARGGQAHAAHAGLNDPGDP